MQNKDSIYLQNGYKNRDDYLESLSEDYGVPLETVYSLADTWRERRMGCSNFNLRGRRRYDL